MNIIDISRLIRPTTKGWAQDELASLYRSHGFLVKNGLPLGFDQGCTDIGEPWCVFYDLRSEEVVAHFARIEGQYVIAGGMFDKAVRGRTLAIAIEKFDRAIEDRLRLTCNRNGEGSNVVVHPSAKMVLSLATLFFLMQLDQPVAEASSSDDRIGLESEPDHPGGHWLARIVNHSEANANHIVIAALMGFYLANKATDDFHLEDLSAVRSATEKLTTEIQSDEHSQDQIHTAAAADDILDLSMPVMPNISAGDQHLYYKTEEFAGTASTIDTSIYSEMEALGKEYLDSASVADVVNFAKQFVYNSTPDLWDSILRATSFEMELSPEEAEIARTSPKNSEEDLGSLDREESLTNSAASEQPSNKKDSDFASKEKLQDFSSSENEFSAPYRTNEIEVLESAGIGDEKSGEPTDAPLAEDSSGGLRAEIGSSESGGNGNSEGLGNGSSPSEQIETVSIFSASMLKRLVEEFQEVGGGVNYDAWAPNDPVTGGSKQAVYELFHSNKLSADLQNDFSSILTATESEDEKGLTFVSGNVPEHAELLIGVAIQGTGGENRKTKNEQLLSGDTNGRTPSEYGPTTSGNENQAQKSILEFIEKAGNIAIYSYGADVFLIEQSAIAASSTQVAIERIESEDNSFTTLIGVAADAGSALFADASV